MTRQSMKAAEGAVITTVIEVAVVTGIQADAGIVIVQLLR